VAILGLPVGAGAHPALWAGPDRPRFALRLGPERLAIHAERPLDHHGP
jgi:hypothetical protein